MNVLSPELSRDIAKRINSIFVDLELHAWLDQLPSGSRFETSSDLPDNIQILLGYKEGSY